MTNNSFSSQSLECPLLLSVEQDNDLSRSAVARKMCRPLHCRAWASPRGAHMEASEKDSFPVSESLFLAGITDIYVISSEGCIKAWGHSSEKNQPLAAGTVGCVSLTKCFVFSDHQGNLVRGGSHSLFRDEETEAEGD